MRRHGSRKITVKKKDLIDKIKENKQLHIDEYEKAVVAYKEEALKQLHKLCEDAEKGSTKIKLNLISPINNSENYDKVIEMFEWEVADEVELEQNEFLEYVQDEFDFAVTAKLSNSSYM